MNAPLASYSQATRLLRLHTPLGPDKLLVERFSGREALDEGFRFTVDAVSTDANIDLDALLGQPALVELLTAQSRTEYRPFHAHVTHFERLGADGGFGRYRLTLEPWLAFLAYRRDSYIFQDQSVPQIVDEVLQDYVGQGRLDPHWRWELKDPAEHKPRSLTIQYEESDLAFLTRLLAEEGLFYWFEHEGAGREGEGSAPTPHPSPAGGGGELRAQAGPAENGMGRHTLVIADHNGACRPNAQARVAYRRADATEREDTVQRIASRRRLATNALELLSWDYRSVGTRPVALDDPTPEGIPLTARDAPGAYAYTDSAEGERTARHHLEALAARRAGHTLAGTLRTAAPGSTLTLQDPPGPAEPEALLLTAVDHQATNNLAADPTASLPGSAGWSSAWDTPAIAQGTDQPPGQTDPRPPKATPLYRCRMSAVPARLPWRPLREGSSGKPIHPRPTVAGLQTALVVGVSGAPLTADRDHRIKIQFHWQRGDQSHNTQTHPGGSNAPADETAGTWVRVLTPVAGANWGGHFLPRIGQEVLVAFLEGDIDRPVVIGAAWNGRGQTDSQANGTGASVGSATANAPAWFPGGSAPGAAATTGAQTTSQAAPAAPASPTPTPAAENHTHRAIFSGWKTQELKSSQSGQGGYNALIFDDTPAQAGLRLQSTQYASALNLGHLKQQTDNRRQKDRGHGAELVTGAYGALRAGAGLLVTADARPGAGSPQLDAREALAQTVQGKELTRSLAATAQKQGAKLQGEAAPDKLPTLEQWQSAETTLTTTAQRGEPAGSTGQANPANDPASPGFIATQGGTGTVPAWDKPLMALSAPAGIGAFTPADALLSAGQTLSLAAGQDANFAVQGTSAWAVRQGIVLFTHGQAQKGQKPNQETGIKLHAASGNVSMQSQSDETTLAAQKQVTVASTTQNVTITAPQHILLTAGGAYIRIEGGNIQLHAPGKVTFHSSMKTLTGPESAGASLSLPKGDMKGCATALQQAAAQQKLIVPL